MLPPLSELLGESEMGGSARRKQVIEGTPVPGGLAEPGVLPARRYTKRSLAREEPSMEAQSRVKFGLKEHDWEASHFREEAVAPVGEGVARWPLFSRRGWEASRERQRKSS